MALLRLYDVTDDEEINRLVGLARISRQRPWYNELQGVVNPDFAKYLGYENSASTIRDFQPLIIPGLLQTDDYARAVLSALGASRIDDRVDLRMQRQERLEGEEGPYIVCVVDEAALRRDVGGPAVMRRQLRQLQAAAGLPKVSVAILPFTAGAHPGMLGSFAIIEFDDEEDDVLYLENADGSMTNREERTRLAEYRERFDLLSGLSLSAQESDRLINSIIHTLETADPSLKME
jgi:Domain of unknown function (DUF5753)